MTNHNSKSRSLEEIFRRYEFNKTEPETLASLVQEAMSVGDGVRAELKRFGEMTGKVLKLLEDKKVILVLPLSKIGDLSSYEQICAIGIDGSLQPLEGFGGYWFVPTSCAAVHFENGPASEPKVTVSAKIEKIREYEHFGVGGEAVFRMMTAETKAIMTWAETLDRSRRSAIFIDGPIVDPPQLTDQKYVKYRCEALTECLKKEALVIGCVKRMKAQFFIEFLAEKFTSKTNKNLIMNFSWDTQLVTALFSKLVLSGIDGILSTIPVNTSDIDATHKAYKDSGIDTYSFYMQKDATSRPIRLDFPALSNTKVNLGKLSTEILKTTYAWSYPGIDVPLPVFLAHNKCAVRRGCAEVLYNEIITRSSSTDPFENYLNEKLKVI